MLRKISLCSFLFLTFAFSVASFGLFINAFIKSTNDQKALVNLIPFGTVQVADSDILNSGKASTVINALLAVLSLSSLSLLAFSRLFSAPRAFVVLSISIAFCSLGLLASMIAYTVIFATKSANVSGTFIGIPLPPSIIGSQGQALGLSPTYKSHSYLRLPAIVSWFTVLFSALAVPFMWSESKTKQKQVLKEKGSKASQDFEKSEGY